MYPAHFSGAPESLLVREKGSDQCPEVGKTKRETLLKPGANGAATHLIQRIAVPPAIHIGFTEAERPRGYDSAKETPVVDLYVPVP
jgi:hypothetical protein